MSQEDLARAAECTVATINRIERGKTVPELGTLRRIAEVLGVPFQEVFSIVEGDLVPLYLPRPVYDALVAKATKDKKTPAEWIAKWFKLKTVSRQSQPASAPEPAPKAPAAPPREQLQKSPAR